MRETLIKNSFDRIESENLLLYLGNRDKSQNEQIKIWVNVLINVYSLNRDVDLQIFNRTLIKHLYLL